MRTLLLLRGVQGSGKSTFIKENNLEAYTISTDVLRLLYQSPVMNMDGFGISQTNNKKVFKLLHNLVEERMKRGEFIVIEATNTNEMINQWKSLADYYKYSVFVKEIKVDLETAVKRNLHRGYKEVPVDVIKSTYEKLDTKLPSFVKEIETVDEIINYVTTDLSKYRKIVFIGDIHGCYEPLKELFKEGIKEEIAYVFLGDYIDRGLQNKEVIQFLLSIYNRSNVYMLEGNHEGILNQYARGEKYSKPSFDKTAKELESIDKKELKKFYKKLLQCMKIKYHHYNFLVTHGGLPFKPKELTKVATSQLIKGVGKYEDDIDLMWDCCEDDIQIHGHRSLGNDYPCSYSLEGEIEYGGHLKTLEVTKSGIKVVEYKNDVYDTQLEFSSVNSRIKTPNVELNRMINSRHINVKQLDDNIVSLNFSKTAFKNQVWNRQTIKARGLFVDKITGEVVARSFDKFFSLNENRYTEWRVLKNQLHYPLKIYKKENGFLGILSHRNGELAFYSKSTNTSDYAKWFKDIFLSKIGDQQSKLLELIVKHNISLVFEVIDAENDPHIIEYNDNELIFLDSFENKLECVKGVHTEEIVSILSSTNIKIKELMCIADTQEELVDFIKEHNKDEIEGVVVEDSSGYMFKHKFQFYKQWKKYRGIKHHIDKGDSISNRDKDLGFVKWYKENIATDKNIIEIRKNYLTTFKQ